MNVVVYRVELDLIKHFLAEEHCMRNYLRTSTKIISFLLSCVLLIVPLSSQVCSMDPRLDQGMDKSSDECCGCCSQSSTVSSSGSTDQNDCPCGIKEKQPEENSPVIIVSYNDNKPEAYLVAGELELLNADSFIRQTCLRSHTFYLPSRDRPLYILNSTFLI